MPRSWRGLGSAASRRPLTACSPSATGGIAPGVPGSHCGRSRTWRAALNAGFLAHNIFPRALREGWRNILPLALREAAWGEAASLGGCVHPAPSSSLFPDAHGGCSTWSGSIRGLKEPATLLEHDARIVRPAGRSSRMEQSRTTSALATQSHSKTRERTVLERTAPVVQTCTNNPRDQTTPETEQSLGPCSL